MPQICECFDEYANELDKALWDVIIDKFQSPLRHLSTDLRKFVEMIESTLDFDQVWRR